VLAGLIIPPFAEQRGRKPAIILTIFLGAISTILAGFANHIYLLMIALFFAGIGFNGF
jgi:MFS family permease